MTIFILNGNEINAQITFDWDTAPIDNGDNVTETINGITVTFTGTSTTGLLDVFGFGGSFANVVSNTIDGSETTTNVIFNFSESVDITSVLALEGYMNNIDFTFTPVGGSNSTVVASLNGGIAQVNLNWTGVTSFTVSSTGSTFLFDNLILNSSTLSTNDFASKTIKVFPNPSSEFIQISSISNELNYKIYNLLGAEIKKGIIANDEQIDIRDFTNGLYFLKFENGNTIKFLKE
ncbi:MAG: hypothetical protein ABS28_05220 [Cryomorphaceae bacterium BACL22 MAG-120619-bin32]|nr:MAG: hypothetical protein ABS28_05220 [Cryomorphaceae bacterium BACL22 MAG-120619-bin32]